MNDNPSARSLAIRVRSVGSGVVEGSSSRQARNDGQARPYGDAVAICSAVSSTCSAIAVISGDADAYGSSRPSRYTVPPRPIRSVRSVAGRPGPGCSGPAADCWKNSAIACCTVVAVFPAVRSSPCSAPCSRPSQNGAASGWVRSISSGWAAWRGSATPTPARHRSGAAGERGGVEERLQHLGPLGGVEPGRVVCGAFGDGAFDRAGGEGFGPPFGHHRVDTSRDRVPHQLRHARG